MSRHLSAAPEPARKDGIYIRVSAVMGRADDRFLSPDIQREAIDRARQRGPASTVVGEWRDIDVSTAKVAMADRPGLKAAREAAKRGHIDRLWILTLDRFDRDTAALKVFDEIAAQGVELWTEVGRVDIDSPEGYLSTTMQLAIARYQRDRIGKAWKQTQQHRIDRGLTHSGKARWAYIYDRERSLHIPDPATAPLLVELYLRYIGGQTNHSLALWLNSIGSRSEKGNLWTDHSLRRVMGSGFAAGFVKFNGELYPGAHDPLIDIETWQEFLALRERRRTNVNTERSVYLLSGMIRCSCGSFMTAGQYGSQKRVKYRCSAAANSGKHKQTYVMGWIVEEAVMAWLETLASQVDEAIDLALASAKRRATEGEQIARLEAEIERLDEQLVRLTRQLVSGLVPEDAYAASRDEIQDERAIAAGRISELRANLAVSREIKPQKVAADLLADWDLIAIPQRREILRRLIARIAFSREEGHRIIEIIPTWEG